MNAPSRIPTAAYPGKVAIRRVIEAARTCGLDVAGVEVSADGTIKVVEARATPSAGSLFDQFEGAGKI